MGWREWFGLAETSGGDATRTEVVARIARVLDSLPPDRARFAAAFAYHLGRIAHADQELTDDERQMMRTIVGRETGLPPAQAQAVVDLALYESLAERGTEDYRVMHEFDDISTHEEKLALIRCLFAMAAADSRVLVKEDNEIRRIAMALKISHEEFIAARTTVRSQLSVLRPNTNP